MTIDDTIGHCDVTADVAEAYGQKQIAEKYREIGKWLRELKALKDGGMVSKQTVIDVINQLINEFEEICSHIRERNVDDSVCGLCEYDGAYIGQSGDWCNECPGFDKDDCFKLKDGYRQKWLKKLPSAQPETCEGCKHLGKWENEVEYGYPSPCTRCKRRVGDHYER